jgi:hypothetical protein
MYCTLYGISTKQAAHQSAPLSAAALNSVESLIAELFAQHGEPLGPGRRGIGLFEPAQCLAVVTELLNEAAILLKRALKTVYTELADVVPYGNKGCKEWVFAITGIGKTGALSSLQAASYDDFDA